MNGGVVEKGLSALLGATVFPGGVNFSVFSKNAMLIELLLFDDENAAQPAKIISLDANRHHTYHYWHVFVPDLKTGQQVYRLPGPMGHSRRNAVFDSMARRFSSTLMVSPWRFPKLTTA